MVKISIIVPVYNKVRYIKSCIQSILTQSFTDFELILVNDGSTDGSDLICKAYRNMDNRVVLINQRNAGVSAARNAGIEYATGGYIGFVDADDTITADMYEKLLKNALLHNADISICRMRLILNGRSKNLPVDTRIIVLNHDDALVSCLKGELDRSANNKIYKAELAKSIQFEGRVYEDILYISKAFIAANTSVIENVANYNYIIRDNSVSMTAFNINYAETINVSAKIVDLVSKNDPEALPHAHVFDVVANISLLNLLLLSNRSKYLNQYNLVVKNLEGYGSFIKKSLGVKTKHRFAFHLFSLSPLLYKWFMYVYCKLTRSDVIVRI